MNTPQSLSEAIQILQDNIHLDYASAGFPDLATYLGNSNDPQVFDVLLHALHNGGAYIRSIAAISLGYYGKKECVPDLLRTFNTDQGLYVRCDAALSLARLQAEEALPDFLARFPHEHFEVQKRIISAIKRIRTPIAQRYLILLEKVLDECNFTNAHQEIFLRKLITE